MAATIAPIQPQASVAAVAPVGPATSQVTLQPGTVVSAQVLQLLENGLAQIAIEGIVITALTETPLQVGSTLNLAVSQASSGVIKLSIVPPGAAAPPAATAPTAGTLPVAGGAAPAAAGAGTTSATANVPPTAAPAAAASPPPAVAEALAVASAAQAAAPRQQSLAPLFANLPVVVASDAVPPEVQSGAAQLLSLRPVLSEQLSANDVSTAFNQSGLFLEASLAAGAAPDPSTDLKAALVSLRQSLTDWLAPVGSEPAAAAAPTATPSQTPPAAQPGETPAPPQSAPAGTSKPAAVQANAGSQPPVLPQIAAEVALAPLPQEATTVVAALGTAAPPEASTPSPQAGAAFVQGGTGQPAASPAIAASDPMLELLAGEAALTSLQGGLAGSLRALQAILTLAEAAQSTAVDLAPAPLAVSGQATTATQVEAAPNAPPPFRGAAPSAQPVAQPSLAANAAPREIGQRLLAQTDAAIARQTLLQVASLPDRAGASGAHFGGINDTNSPRWSFEIPFATQQGTALAQFEIEQDGGNGNEVEGVQRIWRARFSLNIEPAGPVHALVSLVGEKAAVRMWAERPETASMLRAESGELVQALRMAELEPGDVVISGGAPPLAPARAGRFLDRAS